MLWTWQAVQLYSPIILSEQRTLGGCREHEEGFFKTPTELCVEANENTLKVNGPLGLNSPSYWLPCWCNDLATPVRISQTLSIFLHRLKISSL